MPQLDGIRALAVIVVLIHHASTPLDFPGWMGVDVFFVLSGYLITGILMREIDDAGRIRMKRFYARRLIRLYPPLLLAVAVCAASALLVKGAVSVLANALLAVTYLMPIVTSFSLAGGDMWRHTWSLGIEEIFYLVWPALLLVLIRFTKSRRVQGVLAGAFGVVLTVGMLIADLTADHSVYLLRSGGLFFGCALALVMHRSGRAFGRAWGYAGLALIVVAIVGSLWVTGYTFGVVLTIVGTVLLLMHVTTRESEIVHALGSAAPAYVGRISYELYIWHYPLLVIVATGMGGTLLDAAWIAMPLAIAAAVGSHALLTRPMDRWKARLPYERRARRRAAPATERAVR
ncbi:acyltransferase [uncultured Microbacterium sp.]|uniref:acyltransferase family protein n=1 Tax=uncultured Microbacterium sp. TaxID=191216 RepID=UPI0028D87AE7|nr:acyltransferase [uncultured Microbacterium sp.]